MFKVMPHKCITFQIKGAKRNKAGLYTYNSGYTEYDDCCPVWIAQVGEKCELAQEWQPGLVGVIKDQFELEEIEGIWDHYKDKPEFKLLRDRCEQVDGYVSTASVYEHVFIMLLDLCEPSEGSGRISFGNAGELGEFGIR